MNIADPNKKTGLDNPTLKQEYQDEHVICELCGSNDHAVLHKKVIWQSAIYLIDGNRYMFHETDVMCMKFCS